MSDEQERHEDSDDKSIVNALSNLGWIEEEEKETPISTGENLKEQITFYIIENKRLSGEINEKNEKIESLESNLQELKKMTEGKTVQNQAVQKLYETIESKNDEIENINLMLDEQSKKLNKIINDQIDKIKDLTSQIEENKSTAAFSEDLNDKIQEKDTKIKDLTSQIEEIKSTAAFSEDMNDKIQEKDTKIKELKEQLQYLEDDSIQKSKFDKLEVLLEKKDEIITEKEKIIFNLENNLKTGNQKIQDIQQQFETFNLVKKDLEKTTDRNKSLVVKIEDLNQKIISNQDLIDHLEKKLEEAHKGAGSLTGRFELELGSIRNMLDDRDEEIKKRIEENQKLQDQLRELKQIEDKILTDKQTNQDEKIKFELDLEEKNKEIIELKKRIKLMRRDMKKT